MVANAGAGAAFGCHEAGLQPAPTLDAGERLQVALLLQLGCRVVVQGVQGLLHLQIGG